MSMFNDMELVAPKTSHREIPSMSGAIDLRDTDISDDIESLFPNNFGTSTLRRSARMTKALQSPIENHRTLKAWGKRTFGRNKAFVFERSTNSDNSDSSSPGNLPPLATTTLHNKTRPRINRRKSLSGLVQTMAAMMVKDDTSHDENGPRRDDVSSTRCTTASSDDTLSMDIVAPLATTPVDYLPKAREKSDCSSTFRHGVDDAVKQITGAGLDITSRPNSAEAWARHNAARGCKTPLATPAASIFELPGASAMRLPLDEDHSGPLITLVLPPQEDETQCDAYHLYLHELFAFLGACPSNFSVLGIYDASRRVYYLQPPTSFDASLKDKGCGDLPLNEHSLKTLPAGLRRFLSEIPANRATTSQSYTHRRAYTSESSTSSAMAKGVETEPATKMKLRSDITEILRLLVAHQEEVTNQKVKEPEGPTETEILRNGVRARLSQAFDTISDIMKQLTPELQDTFTNSTAPSVIVRDFSIDEETSVLEIWKPEGNIDKTEPEQETKHTIIEPIPTSNMNDGTSVTDQQVKKMREAPACKVGLNKISQDGDSLFVVNPELLENRSRVPRSDSDGDSLHRLIRRKRGRALSGTGPFFTGSWRHEPRAEFISPFRAARLGQVRGSEVSEAFTDASDESVEGCSAAIMMAINDGTPTHEVD